MKGLEGLRGIGALDLNTQHCDERAPVTGIIVIRKCKISFEAYKVCAHV